MKWFLILLTTIFLVGCVGSSAPPKTHVYLLRADVDVQSGQQTAQVDIGIGRVSLASYLGQSGIVLQTGPDEIRAARQHIWAEPLDQSLRIYMRDAISADLGYSISADSATRQSWDYRIDIVIDQLHGSLEGDVYIDASWVLIDSVESKQLSRHRFRSSTRQRDDGYDALVTAQKGLLIDLAAAISASFTSMHSG